MLSTRTCVLRFQRVEAANGALASYIHLGGKLADIVTARFNNEIRWSQDFRTLHGDAIRVAAAAPVAARREGVPQDIVDHRLSI